MGYCVESGIRRGPVICAATCEKNRVQARERGLVEERAAVGRDLLDAWNAEIDGDSSGPLGDWAWHRFELPPIPLSV